VFDIDRPDSSLNSSQDFVGEAVVNLGDILGNKGGTLSRDLQYVTLPHQSLYRLLSPPSDLWTSSSSFSSSPTTTIIRNPHHTSRKNGIIIIRAEEVNADAQNSIVTYATPPSCCVARVRSID
jgi:hypothetical protein